MNDLTERYYMLLDQRDREREETIKFLVRLIKGLEDGDVSEMYTYAVDFLQGMRQLERYS